MEENKSKIVNAALFIDALKSSGYKSTYNAIAEIVDNSIDARAKDIFILGEQKIASNGEKRIVEFAFLDNGKGMNTSTLANCLCVGYHEGDAENLMGRFGVGLPQASIFVCNKVEVYSWQNGIENCQKVVLDAVDVRKNDLNEIAPPVAASIPKKYAEYIHWKSEEKEFDFSEHGTLVIWSNCTNVDHKKWNTCVNHMSEDLGRKYRYFLAKGTKTISMIEIVSKSYEKILPNDPLYLMTPSQESMPKDIDTLIANQYKSSKYDKENGFTESMFTIYKASDDAPDFVTLPIKYEHNDEIKEGSVVIKYSVVKEEYYSKGSLKTDKKPGSLAFGKSSRLTSNTGISIVRNNREIDFGSFGFFDFYNVPEYRWWGIEISFKSDMDNAFGISNNKQSVNLKPLSKQEMEDVEPGELRSVWHQLALEIKDTIKAMANRNSKVREDTKELIELPPNEASQIAKKSDEEHDLEIELPTMSEEQKFEEAKEQLFIEEEQEPTDNQIKQLIDSGVRVKPVYTKTPHDSFIDYSFAAGTLSIVLNARHPFYEKLIKDIWEDENQKVPFELFIIAVMKSIKHLDQDYSNAMDKLMYEINQRITNYIMEYKKNNE